MARTRTLLYGEPDPHVRDGSRIDAAEREAQMRHELAQLKPGGWQRGARADKGTRTEAPPPPREADPPTLRSVLPPAAPRTLRGASLAGEPETLRVALSPPESAPAKIPPPPSRSTRRRGGARESAVLAGGAVGAAVLVGLGVWLSRRAKSTKPVTTPARRADSLPAQPERTDAVPGQPARSGTVSAPAKRPFRLPKTPAPRPAKAPRKAKR